MVIQVEVAYRSNVLPDQRVSVIDVVLCLHHRTRSADLALLITADNLAMDGLMEALEVTDS